MKVNPLRLFVNCKSCGQKSYLSVVYSSRKEISRPLISKCPSCQKDGSYSAMEIWAEPVLGAPLAGAGLGAIIGGILGGPIGLILGGAVGGTAGAGSEQQETDAANKFNADVV